MDIKNIAIFTIIENDSDDSSTQQLIEHIQRDNPKIKIDSRLLINEEDLINKSMLYYSDVLETNIIIVIDNIKDCNKDVTPDLIQKNINREVNGVTIALYTECSKIVPKILMSRLICGFRNKTIFLMFPGDLKVIDECYKIFKKIFFSADVVDSKNAVEIIQKKHLFDVDRSFNEEQSSINKSHNEQHTDASISSTDDPSALLSSYNWIAHQNTNEQPTCTKINPIEKLSDNVSDQHLIESENLFNSEMVERNSKPQNKNISIDNFLQCADVEEIFKSLHIKLDSDVNTKKLETSQEIVAIHEAIHLIKSAYKIHSVRTVNSISTKEALNYVLADDVVTVNAFPPIKTSNIEGFACLFEDGMGVRVVSEIQTVSNGECFYVDTNDPIPDNANCVVELKDVSIIESDNELRIVKVIINQTLRRNQHITPAGSLNKRGDVIFTKGKLLNAKEMGFLMMLGVTKVLVFNKPSVGFFSVGIEEEKGTSTEPLMLASFFRKHGMECLDYDMALQAEIEQAFKNSLRDCDIVVVMQSAFIENDNILKDILQENFDADIIFKRVDIKHGKRIMFATCKFEEKQKFIYVLPSYPDAAFTLAQTLIMPTLMYWMGLDHYELPRINVWLSRSVELYARISYMRAEMRYSLMYDCPVVFPKNNMIKSMLVDLNNDDVILELPKMNATKEKLEEGSILPAILLR